MKVLLIQCYFTTPVDTPNICLEEPLGLLSLATFLERELEGAADIRLLDLFELGRGRPARKENRLVAGLADPKAICGKISEFKPDVVGVTANFTAYFDDVVDLCKIISGAFKDILLVLGGAHVTMDAENILQKFPFIDCVIRREGEITFLEFLKAQLQRTPEALSEVKGLTYRHEGGIISNEDRPLIEDIDILPIPDRKFINMDFYKRMNAVTLPYVRKTPVAAIMTSRGCPFDCIFCSTKNMWERKFRPFSPERVVSEITYLHRTYGIREFAIQDDQFIVDKKRVEAICRQLIDLKLDVSFSIPAGTSVWMVDEKILRLMKKAGFYRLSFPVESGNENTIKFIRKPIDLDTVKEKIRLANRLGFWTSGNFIIGFPYESRDDIMATIKYAYECGLDFPIFFCAKPFRGADLYDIFVKEGLLKEIIHGSHPERSDYDSKYLTAGEIMELYNFAGGGVVKNKILFYLQPSNFIDFLLPKLRTFNDIKYFFKLFYVMFFLKKIEQLRRRSLQPAGRARS